MSGGNWIPGLAGSRYTSKERVRQMLDLIATEAVTQALQEALDQLDADTIAALELKASEADLLAHTGRTDNPHSVTAGQVGAPTTAQFTGHTGNTSNPHATTAVQVGADPAGTAASAVSAHESAADPHPQYAGGASAGDLTAHTGNTDNPHSVTATQVGLGNVDNTSDADKPVSTATQTALNLKADDADLSLTDGVVADHEEGVFGVQSLTGAGALSLTAMTHLLTADGAEQAITLADGVNGQLKIVVLAAAGGGDSSVLTPTTTVGWTDATLDGAGQALTLAWTAGGWAITANNGATVT